MANNNEYLGMLQDGDSSAAPANPYADILQRDETARDAQFRASATTAIGVDPDQAATRVRVAKYLGVPPPAVDALPADAERAAKLKQLDEATKDAPATRRAFTDADFARLAHDDADNLSLVEKAVGALKYVVSAPDAARGGLVSDAGRAGRALASGIPTFSAGAYGAAAAPFELIGNPGDVGGFLRYLQREQQAKAKDWMGADPNAGLVERGVMSGFQSAGQNLVTLPLGMARGTNAMLAAMGTTVFGQSYGKARDAGKTPAQATPYGVEDAAAEVITEKFMGAAGLLKQIKAGAPAAKMLMYELTREVPGEVTATLWQNFNEWTNLNPEKSVGDFLAEQPAAAAETVIATLVGGSTQIGVVKGIERMAGREQQAQQADQAAQALQAMSDLAAASKVRGRDVSTFERFVAQAAEDGPVSDVYVSATTLAQSGVDIAALAQASPSVAAQIEQAAATGGDIRIPVEEFAGRIAGTDLAQSLIPHLKTDPAGMSQLEAQTFTQSYADELQAEVERTLTEKTGGDAFQASRDAVTAQVLEQLNKAGRFTADVNSAYASMVGNFYAVQGAKVGLTPEQMAERYPLQVRAERLVGAKTLDQGITEDEYIKRINPTGKRLAESDRPTLYAGDIEGAMPEDAKPIKGTFKTSDGQAVQLYEHSDTGGVWAKVGGQEAGFMAPMSDTETDLSVAKEYQGKGIGELLSTEYRRRNPYAQSGGLTEAGERTARKAFRNLKNQGVLLQSDLTVQVDGVRRPITNSKGQPVAEDMNKQLAFWRWFGGSKVADEQGRPLVVYHGTIEDFDKFDVERAGAVGEHFGSASFFTTSPVIASGYSQRLGLDPVHEALWGAEERRRSEYSKAVLAQFRETKTTAGPISDPVKAEYDRVVEARRERRKQVFTNEVPTPGANIVPIYVSIQNPHVVDAKGANYHTVMKDAFEAAKESGADGIIVRNVIDSANEYAREMSDVYVAFRPEQIKSATGNDGTFDGDDPSILSQGARGSITLGDDITQVPSVITLLQKADLSTFLHESGHFYLEVLADMASRDDAPQSVKADMDAVLKWFGVPDLATWNGTDIEAKRDHHETFARGFEAYLFEGKAPSVELAGMFQKFRAWLLNVYRSLAALNVTLTDEVRGVFDRMLASTEAIKESEAARGYAGLFESKPEFMTDDEWLRYQSLGQNATQEAIRDLETRSLRDMQWLSNAKSKKLKELQREAESKRRAVRAEVEAEVMAEPINKARKFLRTGEMVAEDGSEVKVEKGFRLNTDALREMYPETALNAPDLSGLRGMTSKEGLHPDLVAEMFGFTSGDHLVRELLGAEKADEKIEGITDQRMLERYGDLTDPRAIARAADAALHDEARTRFVATELAALEKAMNAREDAGTDARGRRRTVATLPRAAKAFAEATIARLKVRNIKPAQYAAAAARAAKAADTAFKKGDLQAAAVEKRNQLVNSYADRAAHAAQAEVEKALAYFKKFDSEGTRKSLDADYLEQIDALLARFDLRTGQSLRAIDRRKSLLEWAESQREMGFEPDVPPELLNEAARKSFRDMTVEELRGLRDTIKQIEHLARLKHKLLTAKDQREYEAIRDEIAASIVGNAGERVADTRTPTTNMGRAVQGLRRFFAAHVKAATWARILDGGKDGGPVWEYFIRSANERGDMETTMRAEATEKLSAILAPVFKLGKMGGKGQFFPSIGRSLNRESRLAIALNVGNASNLQRLLGGEGWTMAQVQPVLDSLSKEEWDAVQAVWDHFEEYRSLIEAKERRVYGKAPEWLEPTPVQTPHGEYRGGYYPVKYDPAASQRAEEHADAEGAKRQLQGAYTSATTRRSFTKARAEEVHGRPLLYSLAGLYSGVNDVIHDLAWHEWLIDANRLLRSQAIDAAIRNHYGPEAKAQFKEWAAAVAEGDAGASGALEVAIGKLRQNVSVAGLGFNVMSAALQGLGLTQSIVRVGPTYMARGIAQFLASPLDAAKQTNEKSDFMRNRARTRYRELNELRNRVQADVPAADVMKQHAYVMMMRCQQLVDVPTWLGAYDKAIGEGNDEARAVALADQAVIDAQGGGQNKDLAAIERGGPFAKLFTTFYTFMNTAFNLGVAETMTESSRARLAAKYLMLYTVPAVMGTLLKDALTPGDAGDDDLKKLAKKLAAAQLSYLMGMMVVVREFGEAANIVTGQRTNGYAGPAGVRIVADTMKFGQQAAQGEFDDAFRKAAINLAGDALGLPAAQVNRTITGTKALAEGKTNNPAAVAFGFQEKR